jgi:hypothetical protein
MLRHFLALQMELAGPTKLSTALPWTLKLSPHFTVALHKAFLPCLRTSDSCWKTSLHLHSRLCFKISTHSKNMLIYHPASHDY